MDKAISTQNPAVVLRSHFNLVRALLVVALIAVAGLSAAVVIVANENDDIGGGTGSASQAESINYGGFNPATGRPNAAPLPQDQAVAPAGTTRFDGGPEEGTRGPVKDYSQNSATGDAASGTRFDGGPEEGTRGPGFNAD